MFADVHIITNRGRDYESIPRESKGSYHAFNSSKAIRSPVRTKSYFEIVNGPHGIYLVATNLSNRTDFVSRRISTSAILRVDDLKAALHIFDARHSILEWSENRWQDKPGGSDDDLLKILKKVKPKTTEEHLSQWQASALTETQQPPPVEGSSCIQAFAEGHFSFAG